MKDPEDLIRELKTEKQNRRDCCLIAESLAAILNIDRNEKNLVLVIGNRLAQSNAEAIAHWVSTECIIVPENPESLGEELRRLEMKLRRVLSNQIPTS